jgi:hypothetical protein
VVDMTAVQKNIFPGAHDAVWRAFPWHKGAASPHSSQALALSVFGTLAMHPSKQVLIDDMVRTTFGWEPSKKDKWQVGLEVNVPRELLGEPRPTQVDVLLHNRASIVALECKFTESGGGCSQTRPRSSGKHKGKIQCDGNYRKQVNPANGKRARCALSAKGIRYWRYVPKYFDWANDEDYEPCPFAGPAYQYMRNALTAARLARRKGPRRAGFGLVYVTGKQYPMSIEVGDPASEWNQFAKHLRPDAPLEISAVSYQDLLDAWRRCRPEDQVLADLAEWFARRAQGVGETI